MKPTNWFVLISIVFLSACDSGSDSSNNPSPDTFYSETSIFNGIVSTAALDENSDDIYVGGRFTTYNGTGSNHIIRLNSDGSIDTGFNIGSGFNERVYSIASTADGSGDIYVGGSFNTYNGTSSDRIIRLNSDGSVDTGFNVGTGFNRNVHSIVLATDGSGDIYVGGSFYTYNSSSSDRIIRLNSDGSVDTGFNVGSGFDASVLSIALATDGSGDIFAGGEFSSYRGSAKNKIARIKSNGDNDNTVFNVGSGFNGSVVTSIAPATDGSGDIFAGGFFTSYRGNARNYITRIKSDGSNDPNFGIGAGFNRYVDIVVAATDGSGDIFVGGSFDTHGATNVGYFARLDSVGQLR